jgi:hypothetical protein
MSKKKRMNKEIEERNSAWGKPLPPTMGKDIPPGIWVSEGGMEWRADALLSGFANPESRNPQRHPKPEFGKPEFYVDRHMAF